MEEAATPLPSEETTPPVTNIYFCAIRVARQGLLALCRTVLTSAGLTYKQLSSLPALLSNQLFFGQTKCWQRRKPSQRARERIIPSLRPRNFFFGNGFEVSREYFVTSSGLHFVAALELHGFPVKPLLFVLLSNGMEAFAFRGKWLLVCRRNAKKFFAELSEVGKGQ